MPASSRARVWSGRLAAIFVAGFLGACAAGGDATRPAPASAPAPNDVAALPPPTAAPSPPDPAKFVGMKANEIAAMLGEPSFRRRDPPAEIWQYRSGSCVLDLFLYSDGQEKPTYAVTHAEARQRGSAARADADCLGRIVRERAPPPTS